MSFISLLGVELKKIRRSGIFIILFAAAVFMWLPAIFHADVNFKTQAEIGITPEHNFLIQGFMGLAWFMFPACMVVCTVLICQTERGNHGILKMLALPLNTGKLCLAKFAVLLALGMCFLLFSTVIYFVSAAIVSKTQSYDFMLSPVFVLKEAGLIFLTSIPMMAFFWLLSVCIRTPIFAMGAGFASIVPSVLMINTKFWFAYPMAYPFFAVTNEYAKLAERMAPNSIDYVLWGSIALSVTLICIFVSCFCFGQGERR